MRSCICDPGLPCFPLPHPGLEALTSGFMTRIRLDLYVPFRPLAKVLSCPFLTFSSYAHRLLTRVISLILTPDCIMKTETCVYFLQFLLAQKQTPISSPPLGLDSFSSLVLLHSAPCLNHVFCTVHFSFSLGLCSNTTSSKESHVILWLE